MGDLKTCIKKFNNDVINKTCRQDTTDPITLILDNVFLGQGRTTLYGDFLKNIGITCIVSVGRPPHGSVKDGSFNLLEITNLSDTCDANIGAHFPQIFEFMKKSTDNNGKIYVHCEMGCSRAATVIIAYLKYINHFKTIGESFEYVKSLRPWINPNKGFINTLNTYFCD